MKTLRFTALFIITALTAAFPQEFRFGWISDIHNGSKNSDALENIVDDINKRDDIRFVVITGDISENGLNPELESAKRTLDRLKVKYHLFPGEHDTRFSESGGAKFIELWGSDKFDFEYEGIRFIGLSNAYDWHGGPGHFTIEGLKWLDSVLAKGTRDQEIVFLSHYPLSPETDNWFKATNLLRNYNIKTILTGNGHKNQILNFNGIPSAMGREASGSAKTPWGYNIVQNRPDSLLFYDGGRDSLSAYWGAVSKTETLSVPQIDSAGFTDYTSAVTARTELGTSIGLPPLVWNRHVYTASPEGLITCLDSTGRKVWEFPAQITVVSRPVIADNLLVFATITGDLYTLNAETGSIVQTVGIGEPITSQLISITYKGDKFLIDGSKPDTSLIIGTSSGRIMCYDINSLDQLWENSSSKGMIASKPLYAQNKVIFGSRDGYLYCIDARSGVLIWKWSSTKNPLNSLVGCTPVTDGNFVYVSASDKTVSSVDLLLGKLKWKKENIPASGLALSGDKTRLLVKGSSDKFYIIAADNGKLIKEINIKSGADASASEPLEYGGRILSASGKGTVHLIDSSAYSASPLFFAGTSRMHPVMHLSGNKFVASNYDGTIIIFELK